MLDKIKNYAIAVLALFAGYFYISNRLRPPCPPQSPAVVQEIKKEQKITTTVTKPNGTTTIKVVETVKEIQTEKIPVAGDTKSRYDIHASADPWDRSDVTVGVGARIGDLPAFGTVDYRVKDRSVLVGVRIEF